MQRYDGFVLRKIDDPTQGNVATGVSVEVRNKSDSSVANLFSDSAGTVPKDNPLTTDNDGRYWFYAADGSYIIDVASGSASLEVQLIDRADISAEIDGAIEDAKVELISTEVPTLINTHNEDVSAHPSLLSDIADIADLIESISVSVDAITADPANAVDQIWIPAQALESVSGTATLVKASSRVAVWRFPDNNAASSYTATVIRVPSHWNTMYVYFILANTAANAGNVVMAGEVHNWAIGESFNATPSGSSITTAMPTSAGITHSARTAAAVTVDPAKYTTLRIGRVSSSVNDTLLNDVDLLGVIIEKVT